MDFANTIVGRILIYSLKNVRPKLKTKHILFGIWAFKFFNAQIEIRPMIVLTKVIRLAT